MVIKYEWITADKLGYKDHPQKVMKDLGCKVTKYEAVGIADCSFMEVDRLPNPLPEFVSVSDFEFTIQK
jgi:hypothetical protein